MNKLLCAGAATAFLNLAAAGPNLEAEGSCADASLATEQLGDIDSIERDANVFVAQIAGRILCLSELGDNSGAGVVVSGDFDPMTDEVNITLNQTEEADGGFVQYHASVTFQNVLPSYESARLDDVVGFFVSRDENEEVNHSVYGADGSVSAYRFETPGIADVRVFARYHDEEDVQAQSTETLSSTEIIKPLEEAWLKEQSARANTMLDGFSED